MPRSLDPDDVRMELQIEFFDRFLMELVLVEVDGKLFIGKYKAHDECSNHQWNSHSSTTNKTQEPVESLYNLSVFNYSTGAESKP